jgi:hypothetical protein
MTAMFLPAFARHANRALVGALAMLLLTAAPSLARAETNSSLPQGYASDEFVDDWRGDDGSVANEDVDAASTPQPAAATPQSAPAGPDADEYADTDPSALSDFREPLAPYGSWVDDATYGTVWVPSATVVGADFAPYQTAGHWELDASDDWLWVSDYDWGYVPFHYGRWVWVSGRGWAWIPGRQYAPAWVVWRTGTYGYIGWAPMPPAFYWTGGLAVALWAPPPAAYVFCSTTHVFAPRVTTYVIRDRGMVRAAASRTAPYRAVHPSMGGRGGAASPRGARASYRPASPSLKSAGIAPSAAPRSRAAGDARALGYARPSARGSATGRSAASAPRSSTWAARHGVSTPSRRSDPSVQPRPRSSPTTRSPSRGAAERSPGSYSSRGSAGPTYRGSSPASRPAPSRQGSSSRAAPRYSPPLSRSAPSAYGRSAAPRSGYGMPRPAAKPSVRPTPRGAPAARSAPVRRAPASSGGARSRGRR